MVRSTHGELRHLGHANTYSRDTRLLVLNAPQFAIAHRGALSPDSERKVKYAGILLAYFTWLGDRDSNPDTQDQNLVSYH